MNRVFCYFEELASMKPDTLLLAQWEKSWRKFGWEPERLTRDDALAVDPVACEDILGSRELGRGTCPDGYNYATHLRWVAHQKEGGLITDYDIINNGFTPEMMARCIDLNGKAKPIFLNACECCCAVYAEPEQAHLCSEVILHHAQQAQNHAILRQEPPWLFDKSQELSFVVHDQAIFQANQENWTYPKEGSYIVEFGNPGWQNAPLIHFCNAKTKSPRGRVVSLLGLKGLR